MTGNETLLTSVERFVEANLNHVIDIEISYVTDRKGRQPDLPQFWQLRCFTTPQSLLDAIWGATKPGDPDRPWVSITATVPQKTSLESWERLLRFRYPGASRIVVKQ